MCLVVLKTAFDNGLIQAKCIAFYNALIDLLIAVERHTQEIFTYNSDSLYMICHMRKHVCGTEFLLEFG